VRLEVLNHIEDLNTLEMGDQNWTTTFRIYPENNLLKLYQHPDDYMFSSKTTYEYKIENSTPLIRCIEDESESLGKSEYRIKDNVVLENDIRAGHDGSAERLDEILEKCRREVEWTVPADIKLKYFLLFRSPNLISEIESRKLARKDLERIRNGFREVSNSVLPLGAFLKEVDGRKLFSYPKGASETLIEKIGVFFKEDFLGKLGVKHDEISNFTEIEGYLMGILGDASVEKASTDKEAIAKIK
jgi:hypothetical protein